ncbi:hypothetical protein TUN199_07494 [Pyrenophora tritici-repentis]|nr:hypothetical protein Alg130_07391 [Pyrenophora tritici-repentis]KAI0608255.1 hypothetical protein TUN205_07505 [Pyrenophora tritici-repentis]KAI0620521.1 hypothetical protein TUN199_07494 [Pyrenophora tritici-repentis]
MTSFTGPWSTDLTTLNKSIQSIPSKYKSAFTATSQATLSAINAPTSLHIWESSSDLDALLQLTSTIASLCDLGVRSQKDGTANANTAGGMIILADEKSIGGGVHNFQRICELVGYLTCVSGKKHLEGTVAVYGKVVVVRGWDSSICEGQAEAMERCVKRVNTAVERVLKMGKFGERKEKAKIVWHQGPVIWFLLQWINNTTSSLRNSLSAITVTDALDLTASIKSSVPGRANTLPHVERLEQYAKKLGIPVVFLDTGSQEITLEYLGTYMFFFAYYINTFLPRELLRPHLHKAQDELVTFAFRLRAASENVYGEQAVKMVKKHLDAGTAKQWASRCVDKTNYEKGRCRAAGEDEAIHHTVQLADSPFALLSSRVGIPAFARLAVGPASAGAQEWYTAAPVSIGFAKAQIRPSCPATFHILVPKHGQDLEKVTNRVQGLMMAVLERVRQEKGNPVLGDAEKSMWKAVVKACEWAIDGSEGKMPSDVAKKVKFVKQKLKEGTWGCALELPEDAKTTVATTPALMPETNRTYGFGMGTQQTMGAPASAPSLPGPPQNIQHQMPPPMPQNMPPQMPPQNMQHQMPPPMPQQIPQQGAQYTGQVPMVSDQMPQQGQYAPAPVQSMSMGQGQGREYVPNPMTSGGYQQSMGGPWR